MGSYISQTDLEYRIGGSDLAALINDTNNYAAKVAKIISYAEGRVNGYAHKLYTVPLPSTATIQDLALAIAEYRAHELSQSGDVPKKIKDSFDDAIKTLIDLAKGDFVPPPSDTGEEASLKVTGGLSFAIESDTTLMTEERFNGNGSSVVDSIYEFDA